jgi:tetratricopeptide (TPR) repeat protein
MMRLFPSRLRFTAIVFSALVVTASPSSVRLFAQSQAQPGTDPCGNGEPSARIAACTDLLNRPNLTGPARIAGLVNRAIAYDSSNQTELAVSDVNAALAIDARSGLALRARAAIAYRNGRTADAIRDLDSALAAQPDDLAALRLRGSANAASGRLGAAVEDFSKVLDRAPADLAARQGRGLALAAGGDHGRAIQDFTRVLERDPRARVSRAARAFSLFKTRQFTRAIGDWDQLLKDDPAQLAIVYCRGAARLLSGDESGRADMESVRQQKPDVAAAEARACPIE